jgi:outer membrane protein OmpA-like peptidoglycan-associated protein
MNSALWHPVPLKKIAGMALCLILVVASAPVQAQLRVGITGAYTLNRDDADFAELRNYPVFAPRTAVNPGPANFRQGSGSGFSLGVLGELPLGGLLGNVFGDTFGVSLRASFTSHNALFTTLQPTLLGNADGTFTENNHEYRIQSQLTTLGVEALLTGRIWGGLYAGVGAKGAYALGRTFAQEERLQLPTPGGFDAQTFSPVRNVQSGTVLDAAPVQAWAVGVVGWRVPVSNVLSVAPEISYALALTNVLADGGVWRMNSLRAGLNITMRLGAEQTTNDDETEPHNHEKAPLPTPVAVERAPIMTMTTNERAEKLRLPEPVPASVANILRLDVLPVGLLRLTRKSGGITEREEPTTVWLPQQEVIARNVFTLLPYIFFDAERSVTIPDRYALLTAAAAGDFSPEQLRSASTFVPKAHPYYHLLNVVGYRMKRIPQARLTITGYTDGFSSERENPKVSRGRAVAVAWYLQSVWGIDSSRLTVTDGKVPPKPSRPLHVSEMQAENRRVELSADTAAVLDAVFLADTVLRDVQPVVRVYALGPASVRPASWRVSFNQQGTPLKELFGDGFLPRFADWRADSAEMRQICPDIPMDIMLTVNDSTGAVVKTPLHSLAVKHRVIPASSDEYCENILIETYNLLLFDGTRSTLTPEQTSTLKSAYTRMTELSAVRIEGYMDTSPDEDFAQRLALSRAQATAQGLKIFSKGAQVEIAGYNAQQKRLYDERLPESRLYSRTVRITVETPLGD